MIKTISKLFKGLLIVSVLLGVLIGAGAFMTVSNAASETVKGAQKDFEVFKKEMNVKIDAVEKEMVELKNKTKQKSSAAQDATMKELEETRDKLKAELNSAEAKGSQSWKSFKKSFAESVEKLNSKVQKALKE